MNAPRILTFGNTDREEFRLVTHSLPGLQTRQDADAPPPDFILIFRTRGERFPGVDTFALKRRFPVTPLIAVLDSWCEGEARTGMPLQGVHNVLWYDFLAMWPLELDAWRHGRPTVWSLPESALPDAQCLLELRRPQCFATSPGNVLVATLDFEQYRLFRDILREISPASVVISDRFPAPGASEPGDWDAISCLLVDFPDTAPDTLARFRALRARVPDATAAGFLEFPRGHEFTWLLEHGLDRLFPKPFRISDLGFWMNARGEA